MFTDRVDAGKKLALRLAQYANSPNTIVLGIPRGGVVVAAEVARELALPLDIVATAKVGAPGNAEYAIGAMAPDGTVLVNPAARVSQAAAEAAAGPARAKVAHELATLRGSAPAPDLAGTTAIVVDDGLATGLTALASARYLQRVGAHVVLAVPVASEQAVRLLEPEVDTLVVLDVPPSFGAVGQFYSVFGQTSDGEVRTLLGDSRSV
jgi:predicted phosphoribosyltransferase